MQVSLTKKSQAHTCCSSRMHPSSQGPCASRQWSLFWSFGSTTLSSPCSRLSSFAHLSLSFSEHGGVGPDVAIAIPAILLRPPPFPPARKCNTTVRRQHRFWSTCLERVSDDKAENQRKKVSLKLYLYYISLYIHITHIHFYALSRTHASTHARPPSLSGLPRSSIYIIYIPVHNIPHTLYLKRYSPTSLSVSLRIVSFQSIMYHSFVYRTGFPAMIFQLPSGSKWYPAVSNALFRITFLANSSVAQFERIRVKRVL